MAEYFLAGNLKDFRDFHETECDGCGVNPLKGNRYDCHSCWAILCESCYLKKNYGRKDEEHQEGHTCKKTPCELDRRSLPSHDLDCTGCKSEKFSGTCYRCKVCPDFYLCQRCYDEDRYAPLENTVVDHREDHEIEKIEPPLPNLEMSGERMLASAIKFQQTMADQLDGSTAIYDLKESEKWKSLGKRIGYALFGNPTIVPEESHSSIFGYSPEHEKTIESLRECCLKLTRKHKETSQVIVSFVFISFFESDKLESTHPLIKVHTKEIVYFIETSGRTYQNWIGFVNDNKLPECTLICPRAGIYNKVDGRILLEKRRSVECAAKRQIARKGDWIGTAGAVVGTTFGVISLFTPFAPVTTTYLLGSTGVWFAARTGQQLFDRKTHQQTVNPFNDKEVFFCWLSLATSAASLGSGAVVARLAKGVEVSRSTRILSNVVIFGALGLNGVGVASSVVNMIGKFKDGKKPSTLEVFQFTAQLLFFMNSVISVKQASEIITEVQNGNISEARNLLATEEERSAFDRMVSANKDQFGEMHGGRVSLKDFQEQQSQQAPVQQSQAVQRHSYFPTADEIQQGALVNGQTMEQQALQTANHARMTRYGGTQTDVRSVTTVLAVDSNSLQNQINQAIRPEQMHGRHNVELKGTWQGINTHYDPTNGQFRTEYVQVENPVFGLRNGRAEHFNAQQTGRITEISSQQFHSQYTQPLQQVTPLLHRTLPPPIVGREDEVEE